MHLSNDNDYYFYVSLGQDSSVTQEVEVKLTNPFSADCDFSIRVVHCVAADLDLDRLRAAETSKKAAAR